MNRLKDTTRYFKLVDVSFAIRPDAEASAARAIRHIAPEFMTLLSQVDSAQIVRCFSVDEALPLWGWEPSAAGGLRLRENGPRLACRPEAWPDFGYGLSDAEGDDACELELLLGSNDRLFEALAPYVVAGSYVVVEDYVGDTRSWRFDGKVVTIEGRTLEAGHAYVLPGAECAHLWRHLFAADATSASG